MALFGKTKWVCPLKIQMFLHKKFVKMCSSLAVRKVYSDSEKIIRVSIASVSPTELISNTLKFDKNTNILSLKTEDTVTYCINRNVKIVAFGKAVLGMVAAVEGLLGYHVVEGVASVPVGAMEIARKFYPHHLPLQDSRVRIYEGAAGNIPDAASEAAAHQVLSLARTCRQQDILLALISGGGSALLSYPVKGVTLEEKREVINCLARKGACIQELNTVRKALSLTKGGKLAQAAFPAKVLGLILSDIVGDPLETIASGPTVPQVLDTKAARRVIEKFKLLNVPASVKTHLTSTASKAKISQREMSSDGVSQSNTYNMIIGSNKTASEAAKETAMSLGYNCYIWSLQLEGEAKMLGEMYALISHYLQLRRVLSERSLEALSVQLHGSLDRLIRDHPQMEEDVSNLVKMIGVVEVEEEKPFCLVGAGEPTVTVTGGGKGGRNQELVLAYAVKLRELRTLYNSGPPSGGGGVCGSSVFVSVGTDGQDGDCDGAGAMVDPSSLDSAEDQGLDPKISLLDNDSYTFFSSLNFGKSLIRTGLTGTNVMDLHLLLLR